MKKIICILAALTVLLVSCASAESTGTSVQVRLEILRDETTLVFTSPDFPVLAVTLSENDAEAVPSGVQELLHSFRPDLPSRLIRSFFAAIDAWTGMQPENKEENSAFAGDAFLKAHIKKSFEVTAENMRNFEALVYLNEPLCLPLYEQDGNEDLSLTGAVYDSGKYYDASLMNGEDCVMTISADLSDPEEIYLVCGFTSGQAFYYNEISAVRDGSQTTYDAHLYRGEESFFSPGEQTVCQTLWTAFSEKGEKQEFSGTFDSILLDAPIRLVGTIEDCEKASVPDGKVEFSLSQVLEYANFWLHFNPNLNLFDVIQLISDQQ